MANPSSDSGPAFPVIAANGLGHISDGMDLRDWFAGQALAGNWLGRDSDLQHDATVSRLAAAAYSIADAMLAERCVKVKP